MSRPTLVVVGGSWGGFEAVSGLIQGLPEPLPVPMLVVLHRSRRGTGQPDLAAQLARRTGRQVVEPEDKEPLLTGTLYLAPADYHLLVDGDRVALSTESAIHHSRPAVDATLQSAAERYGTGLVGIVLTGANADGAAGVRRVRELGGRTMAQDPVTAVRPEMPRAAIATGSVDDVGSLDELAAVLTGMFEQERAHGHA